MTIHFRVVLIVVMDEIVKLVNEVKFGQTVYLFV